MNKRLESTPENLPKDGDMSQRPIEEFVEFEFENEEAVTTEATIIKEKE